MMNAQASEETSRQQPPISSRRREKPPRRGSTGGMISSLRSDHEKIEEIRIKYRRRASDKGGRGPKPRRRSSESSGSGTGTSQKARMAKAVVRRIGSLSTFEVIGALGTALESDDGMFRDPHKSPNTTEKSLMRQERRRSSEAGSGSSGHGSIQSAASQHNANSQASCEIRNLYSWADSQDGTGGTCDTTSVTPSEVTTKRRNSVANSRQNSQKHAEKAPPIHIERPGPLKGGVASADRAGGGITGTCTPTSVDPRDQEIRDLKGAAESSQSSIHYLTNEMRLLNKQLVQDSKLRDEASREEIDCLKAELRASYKKNISISKSSKAEIVRLEFELEKRDATILRLQEELAALKIQRN